jgi:hypothetical protein
MKAAGYLTEIRLVFLLIVVLNLGLEVRLKTLMTIQMVVETDHFYALKHLEVIMLKNLDFQLQKLKQKRLLKDY